MEATKIIAHTKQNPDGSWKTPHDLELHLQSVARMAEELATVFGNGDWAKLAGLWHDLGKYKPAFQKYIREQNGYESMEWGEGQTDKQHAIVGALFAMDRFEAAYGSDGEPFGRVLAYLIAGHHTGLPDWNHEMGVGGALEPKLRESEHLADALLGKPPHSILNAELPQTLCKAQDPRRQLHLWIRMLFSCLVDADFLDTEAYMDEGKALVRGGELPTLATLKGLFDGHMVRLAAVSPVNQLRQEVLTQCRKHSEWEPGLFSLTAPTGGGKTLSSMAFALEHALKHHKRRIIVAIPYTSIIEQTAKQYRDIFGEHAVLEHHSNLDPSRETEHAKLSSENWDSPIVVTTNVQLFESLFAARTSACRKLHNISDSVIILDEAQILPPEFLDPIVSSIRGLTEMFGCSVVLSTATQPALQGDFRSGKEVFHGFAEESVRELIDNPEVLARRLRRVKIERHKDSTERSSWAEIAQSLSSEDQVLCIVNTRRDCRELFDLMPPGTVHLSALMCPEHRSLVIAGIKQSLKDHEPLRVISTQLVEAGVDIDFPVVYRAMAGFDSIAQAAGRCNREGRLNEEGRLGRTVVFKPPKDAPPGLLLKGQYAGEETMKLYPELAGTLDPEVFEKYFKAFFGQLNSFDEKGIMKLLAGPDALEGKVQFRTAATQFTLINNADQVSVIVWYADAQGLIGKVEQTGPYRDLMRRLQRFTVTIPRRAAQALVTEGFLRPVKNLDAVYTQTALIAQEKEITIYDPVFGLRMESPRLSAMDFIG